ncbi:MAG: hypothetical protein GY762_15550 [Proteobacteria bacterium]|nr:hypothetical protein [Pseudomonadota bacterium]
MAKALALLKESYADLTVEILSVENLQTAGEELMTARPACGILEYNIVTSGFYGGCHA